MSALANAFDTWRLEAYEGVQYCLAARARWVPWTRPHRPSRVLQRLPRVRSVMDLLRGRKKNAPTFAHPVERAFAKLLDKHGVPWEYEPKTFVLERNEDGSVHEALTPDFYLPDQDCFIETTVARQCLTTKKRRKVRKVRERHGVMIQVLDRRDLLALADRWRLRGLERAVHKQPY